VGSENGEAEAGMAALEEDEEEEGLRRREEGLLSPTV